MKKRKYNKNEYTVLKYFEMPRTILKYGIKEKVRIKFNIDKNKIISNIVFLKKSSYDKINKRFNCEK